MPKLNPKKNENPFRVRNEFRCIIQGTYEWFNYRSVNPEVIVRYNTMLDAWAIEADFPLTEKIANDAFALAKACRADDIKNYGDLKTQATR